MKKSLLKKDATHIKLLDIAIDTRKTLKKEKEKRKMGKLNNNKYFFIFNFLYKKVYILLENIFRKTYFNLLHLFYRFFTSQVIGNAVIKNQCRYRCAFVS